MLTPAFRFATDLPAIARCLSATPSFATIGRLFKPRVPNLLILDLDDTIIRNTQYLGRDRWFCDHLGKTGDLEKTLPLYNLAQQASEIEQLDPRTLKLLVKWREVHGDNLQVIGLTSRGTDIAAPTIDKLTKLGINFDHRFFQSPGAVDLTTGKSTVHINSGIIFCSGQSKGQCLEDTIRQLQLRDFFNTVFVDDKEKYVREVIQTLLRFHENKDNVHGVHFTFAEHHDYAMMDIRYPVSLSEVADAQAATLKEDGRLEPDHVVIARRMGI